LERSNFTNVFTRIIGSDHQCILSERNTPSLVYQTNSLKNLINRQLIKWFYPRSDLIISVSNGVGQDLIDNFSIPQDIITTIHNPYDIDNILSLSKNNIDEDWLNNDSYQTILSVGNLSKQKAHDLLLKTFSELTKQKENLRLIIAGDGNQYNNLLNLSKELKIEDYVKFTGQVDNPFAYMARADVFVLSSQYEGFPNVLIEAMICKCLTISTDCPSGPNEIIEDKQNGFLIPVGDIQALKNTIIKVLHDPDLRQIITDRAYQSAKSFGVNAIIKRYRDILK
jgi:glycosyltransferase involved in cell wall biosynthesis